MLLSMGVSQIDNVEISINNTIENQLNQAELDQLESEIVRLEASGEIDADATMAKMSVLMNSEAERQLQAEVDEFFATWED